MNKQASLTDYKLEHKKEKVKYSKKNNISSKFTFIEMFSGIAGFRLGLERSGWKCVWANDINKYANKIYHIHYGYGELYEGNIRKVKEKEIPKHTMLTAGFPCQAFSIAGRRKGFEDTRGTLFYEICRIVKAKKPEILFLENVKGLLNHNKGRTFIIILQALDELGYDVEWQLLNSKNFGVPQNRERVFIVGHLRRKSTKKIFPIQETCGNSKIKVEGTIAPHQHQQDTIYDPKGIMGTIGTTCTDKTKISVKACLTPNRLNKRQHGRRFKKDGESMFTLTGQDIHGIAIEKKVKSIGKHQGNKVTQYDSKVHPTLSSQGGNKLMGIGIQDKEMKIRRLTPIECERLQGFPDGWTRWLSDTQRYKALGNAVTVNVIEYLGKLLKECLN